MDTIQISEELYVTDGDIRFLENCRVDRATVKRVFNGKSKSLRCLSGGEILPVRFNKSGSVRVGCSLFSKAVVGKIRAWAFARRKKVSGE